MNRLRLLPTLVLGALALTLAGCGNGNALELMTSGYGGVCWLIHVILVVIAFIEIAKSRHDTGMKVLWGAAVFIFPFVGLIAWWIWGKKG